MMEAAKIIVFDLDQTLAESKMPLDSEMASLFGDLLKHKKAAIISGALFSQFEKQVLGHLKCTEEQLRNLYILPTNAASMYAYENGWVQKYTHELSADAKQRIFAAFDEALAETGFVKPETIHGKLVEDRGAQITFSAFGSEAPFEVKKGWDTDHAKRKAIIAVLEREIPEFSISAGGESSIDITEKGIDKAFGLKKLMEYLGLKPQDILYVGDAIFPGGNDYSVVGLDIPYVSVKEEKVAGTKKLIQEFLLR